MIFILLFSLFACDASGKDSQNPTDDSTGGTSDTGLGLTCSTSNEECGPGVGGCGGEGPTMLPGADCISCHTRGGPGEGILTVAGTVFTNRYGIDPLSGATIRVTDANGDVVTLQSNSVGNFLSSQSVTPPLTAELEVDGQIRAMGRSVETGACNSCHTCDGVAGGKLAGPQ